MFTSFVVHAVVGLTLGLIAHVVVVVFVVVILYRIFCIWRYTLYSSRRTQFAHCVLSPETTFETHHEVTVHFDPVRQHRDVYDCRMRKCDLSQEIQDCMSESLVQFTGA